MAEPKVYSPFQRALLDELLAAHQDVPGEDDLSERFSEDFLRWGDKCIRWSRSDHFRKVSVVKKILIAAIIGALMIGTAMAYPAIRDAVIKYYFTEHEDRFGIVFDPAQAATAPREIEAVYHVGYVPAEYIPMAQDITSAAATYFWATEAGQSMIFNQFLIPENAQDDSSLGIDNNAVRKSMLIGDFVVDMIQNREMKLMIWTNNAYFFLLEVPDDMPQAQIEQIILSVDTQ